MQEIAPAPPPSLSANGKVHYYSKNRCRNPTKSLGHEEEECSRSPCPTFR